MNLTKSIIEAIPSQCGVYLFVRKKWPLYIGKAINLKARILSHFQNVELDTKEKLILENTDEIKTLPTDSEFKALLLEADLIKKYKPKYNVRWKDDKNFLYIKITIKEKYPKILIVRKENDGRSLYFGPFSSTRIVNNLLREIRKIIPFCSQKKLSKKACFYSKIGLCHPCPNNIERAGKEVLYRQYRSNIRKVISILKGKTNLVSIFLEKELKTAIKEEKYEEGLRLRNKIYLFKNLISERSFADVDGLEIKEYPPALRRIECYDVSNLFGREATASMVVFTNGLPDKKEYKRFRIKTVKEISDTKMLSEVLKRRFTKKDWPLPDVIVIDGGKPQLRTAIKILNDFKINLPLLGLAKDPDRIVTINKGFKNLYFKENSPFFNLLKRIRDESHRFAKKYHLLLRKKKMML